MIDLEFVGDYRNPQQLTARQRELGFDGSSAGDFTFEDFIDIINPLQHIPIVSTLYREITGDEISPHARIFGDALFGGPSGIVSSIASVLYEEVAGEDIGEAVIAFFGGEDAADDIQFAAAEDTAHLVDGLANPQAALPQAMAAPINPAAADPLPADSADIGPPLTTTAGGGANLPPLGPGMLTGQDAMSALFADLTGANRAAPGPLPTDEAPVALPLAPRQAGAKSYPLPPRPPHPVPAATVAPAAGPAEGTPAATADAASAHPLIFAQNAGEEDLANRMMQALDKYAAMSRQRRAEKPDNEEDTRWQSDPAIRSGET